MKNISLLLAAFVITLPILAQRNNNMSAVTITVNGNKNLQVLVDGKDYNLYSTASLGTKTTITINDLESGEHTLLFTRFGQNTNRSEKISTIVSLRRRYDMLINVNVNGSLELLEKMKFRNNNNKPSMSNADFTGLLNNVKYQRTSNKKRTVILNALNNTNNYFTSSQIVQLIQQVNIETYRLEMAKLSYRSVTDRNNFTLVYNQLNSQASRNELDDFMNNYYENDNEYDNDDDNDNHNAGVAMSDANFNSLIGTIQQQWPVSTQMSSLTNTFNRTNNYFTSNQASRLIQIVTAENNRLQLAKLSYRSIVDRDKFYQVYELLKSQASRNELENYVNNYRENDNSDNTMTDVNFNSLYQTIQQQWPVSTQMTSLTNAFNNTNNHFSVYQTSRLIQLVSSENSRLQLAKLSYRSITDPANFSQVSDLLNSQASKNELATYVTNYNNGGGVGNKDAMPDANFNNLYQTIQQQWPVSTQMNSLTNAFNNGNYYFTSTQASRLIRLVDAENNRLQLAKLSYRSIIDPVNFNQVSDLLNSQTSKNELTAYINNYSGGGTVNKVPMTDADFNTVYQNVQIQFLPGAKMTMLTNSFNNSNYYFTSEQSRKLVELVSLESNRLQLAKLSYRTITDRGNFRQLYDLFNYQSSRDDLEAYVNAYVD